MMTSYPKAPENIDPQMTEPSPIYKAEVVKCISVVIFFILTYLALIAAATFVALFCFKIGLFIFSAASGTLVWLAGGGVILIGALILFFVLKFVFSSYKTDRSNLIEIHESEQPQLFDFIRKITIETQAPFPKKIYLSNEVNASVFYDSSFWSMFLPVRKNLLIGLGLVNSVTLSEFKAILAHEFGHFSQKSMKVGSYIYNSNRIIHNLLFDNGGFFRTLQNIASVHIVLTICMYGVVAVVRGIQQILFAIYRLMNRQNMKLSREMEFHADSVAASVAGSNPLIQSLYRLELAEVSFSSALSTCNLLLEEQKQEKNIYPGHHFVMKYLGKENQLPIVHHLPQIDRNTFADFDTSRINVQDQWASHPSTRDREEALLKWNVKADEVYESAWTVFTNQEALQEMMTAKLYEGASIPPEPRVSGSFVETKFSEQQDHFQLPAWTKNYWDAKKFPAMNWHELSPEASNSSMYTPAEIQQNKKLKGLETDISTLESIIRKDIQVSGFDFEGVKYMTKKAPEILEKLQAEKNLLEAECQALDLKLMKNHWQKAREKQIEPGFQQVYNDTLGVQKKQTQFQLIHQEMLEIFGPVFRGEVSELTEVQNIIRKLGDQELKAVAIAREILQWNEEAMALKSHQTPRLTKFINQARIYLQGNAFNQEDINGLFDGLNHVSDALDEWCFIQKRKTLELIEP
jgi:Zn-dependent protease with chaperone function